MAKIFVAFYTKVESPVILPFFEGFLRELESRGHQLVVSAHYNWDTHEWGGCNKDIADKIRELNPDLCIIFNNQFYDISDVVKCPILIYGVDSILFFHNKSCIKNNPSRYFFFVDKSTKNILIKDFGVKENQITDHLPFSTIKPQERPIEQNIVFIGTKLTWLPASPINLFLHEKPARKPRQEFMRALDYMKENPFADISEYISKKIITSPLVLKYFNIPYLHQELSDEKRIGVLAMIADLGLTLYGSTNWENSHFFHYKLLLSFCSKRVMTVSENAAAYNSSKIGISAGLLQAVDGFPWRTLDIMQSNACLVSDYHKDFDKLFPKNLFPVYKDAYEAREICKELLSDENKRRKIVKNCQEFAFENFSFNKVAKNINDLIGYPIL